MKFQLTDSVVLFERYRIHLVFFIAAVLLLSGIGSSPVYILDEARNAQAAREMMEHNEWIVPTFNAELRPHKPPLHYYFMRLSYSVFGVNAFSARFFSAVMGWLTIWVTWYFAKRFIGSREAFWSAVLLTISTHFLFEFRLAVPDPYLIFFVTTGVFCFYAFVNEESIHWLIFSAAAAAFAVLAKGPVALVLPGLSLLFILFIIKKQRMLFSWKILLFMVLISAISLPWYIAVHLATDGEFSRQFFFQHNIGRFGSPMEGHGGNFLLIPLFVFIGLLPFSVFVVEATKRRKLIMRNAICQLSLSMTLITLAFFCLSGTKLPNYPMLCYPFIAVLIACWVVKALKSHSKISLYPFWILLVLTIVFLAAAIIGVKTEAAVQTAYGWAFIFIIPVCTVITAIILFKKKGFKPALLMLAAGYTVFNFLALTFAYPAVYRQNPVSKTLHLLPRHDQVYAYKIYNPAYNFYLEKPVVILQDRNSVEQLIRQDPAAKIISRESELHTLDKLPIQISAREKDLFETPVTVIFSGK